MFKVTNERRQWVCGQTGEPGVCSITPIPLERHWRFLWIIPDKSERDGDSTTAVSAMSGDLCFARRAAHGLFEPCDRTAWK